MIPMIFSMMSALCGSWTSPLTPEHLVQDAVSFQEIVCDGEDLYWTELRPKEGGRVQLLRMGPGKKPEDLLSDTSVRTRVNEYGGGAFTVHKGVVYFVNDKDQQIYTIKNGSVQPLTRAPSLRFADFVASFDGKFLYAVCEDHAKDCENTIVKIDAQGNISTVASGHDFFSSPRLSADGKKLSWVSWDHPNMPWDHTQLWIDEKLVAGKEESICAPSFSNEGDLHFISDRTGWWNLYRAREGKIEPLHQLEAEFTPPQWVFGRPSYAFVDLKKGKGVLAIYTREGVDHLALLIGGKLKKLTLPFTAMRNLVVSKERAYFVGGSATLPTSLVKLDLNTHKYEIIKESFHFPLEKEWISQPKSLTFKTRHKDTSYAFYYPPKSLEFQPLKGEMPPLVVKCHGGPTAQVQPLLSLEIQFWTTRGFAFLDVNYSGSTGYGTEYRRRLYGTWGLRDVEDSIDAALYAVSQKLAHRDKLFIRGGSAGGYTTLCALAFHKVFAGGTSYYGVADPALLAQETHKFESHYLDTLIAPYPEKKEIYQERSPLDHVDQFSAPVLLLQGKEDLVVPVNQAEKMYDALKKKGIPVSLIIFDGEQHGFRIATNIKRSIEAELAFYSQLLNLPE